MNEGTARSNPLLKHPTSAKLISQEAIKLNEELGSDPYMLHQFINFCVSRMQSERLEAKEGSD